MTFADESQANRTPWHLLGLGVGLVVMIVASYGISDGSIKIPDISLTDSEGGDGGYEKEWDDQTPAEKINELQDLLERLRQHLAEARARGDWDTVQFLEHEISDTEKMIEDLKVGRNVSGPGNITKH